MARPSPPGNIDAAQYSDDGLDFFSDSSDEWEEAAPDDQRCLDSSLSEIGEIVGINGASSFSLPDSVQGAVGKKRKVNPKQKKKKKRGSDKDAACLHQVQLLFSLGRFKRENEICNDSRVHDALFDLIPPKVLNVLLSDESSKVMKVQTLSSFVSFFASTFRCNKTSHDPGFPPISPDRLVSVSRDKSGTPLELNLLFCSILRGMGKPARLVGAMNPISWRKNLSAEAAKNKVSSVDKGRVGGAVAAHMASELLSPKLNENAPTTWVEVFAEAHGEALPPQMDAEFRHGKVSPRSKNEDKPLASRRSSSSLKHRWVHVDCIRNMIDEPSSVEWLRPKGCNLMYVYAIDPTGSLIDVLDRYSFRPSEARKQHFPATYRAHPGWLMEVLQYFGTRSDGDERTELKTLRLNEQMPTSKNAFRTHPLYAIESLLPQNQIVHNGEPVGFFKGEKVFRREAISIVRTEKQWKQMCRIITEDQWDLPAKVVCRKLRSVGGSNSKIDGKLSSDEETPAPNIFRHDPDKETDESIVANVPLFGIWQTEPYVPPSVDEKGRIPRNEFGNWEVWSEGHVPHGAVHIDLPKIASTVKELNVDYVPAVCGFERNQGRTVPVQRGILVLESMAETILAAHERIIQERKKKQMLQHHQKIIGHWQRFLMRYRIKQYVKDKYDDDSDD